MSTDNAAVQPAASPASAEAEDECLSCPPEEIPFNECPASKRPCGHHCNCSWIHDCCHWCGVEFLGDGEVAWPCPDHGVGYEGVHRLGCDHAV